MNKLFPLIVRYLLLVFSFYIFLFIFPFPAQHFPFAEESANATYGKVMASFSEWVAYTLLGFEDMNYQGGYGSGDTTYDYVQLLTKALLSVVIAVGLMFFGKRISWISQPFVPIRVYARYFVGITLITYGIAKFGEGQFPSASLMSLEQVFGDFSPMGLAWRFFGYSGLYKAFMGFAEISAGALLLFRSTVVIGALLSVAVTFNIFMVNLSFDVPVKILSGHLFLFSVVILWPYLQKLVDILVYRREAQISFEPRRFTSIRQKWLYRTAKFYLVFLIPFSMLVGQYLRQNKGNLENPWEGVYKVVEFDVVGDSIDDAVGTLIVEKNSLFVRQESGTLLYLSIGEIQDDGFRKVKGNNGDEELGNIQITQEGDHHNIIWETEESRVSMRATRNVKTDYFLNNRGFNWINEFPVNR